MYFCVFEHLLAASAWYQGARPNHQHQADQDDQEDPAAQERNHQIDKMVIFIRLIVMCVRKKNSSSSFMM